jgi:hypothetical protein
MFQVCAQVFKFLVCSKFMIQIVHGLVSSVFSVQVFSL